MATIKKPKASLLRSLADAAMNWRSRLYEASRTFNGRRDLFVTFGYKRDLTLFDYRARFLRNEIANAIVKARPLASWGGGCELIEDEDPAIVTVFEQAVTDLDKRLKIWNRLKRADILAGIGHYAVLLIGAPGELASPLESVTSPDEIVYLTPYAEEDASIERYDVDPASPRFGLPEFYTISRTIMLSPTSKSTTAAGKRVHWTRAIHISDSLLDDNLSSEPRLACVWNRIDDVEKVAGGGSEAFFKRADKGRQFDIDPDLDIEQPEKDAMKTQMEEYEHDMRRNLLTRGMTITDLGSDVADFKSQVESLLSLIAIGSKIPQRVFMGSEQGKLAAKQDRASWDNQINERRRELCGPMMVRVLFDRLIELGALPEPALPYEVRWSALTTMDDEQRAGMAGQWAGLNGTTGKTIVTEDEIRERCLDLPPLDEVDEEAAAANKAPKAAPFVFSAAHDEQLLNILEAAIEKGQTDVVNQILGLEGNGNNQYISNNPTKGTKGTPKPVGEGEDKDIKGRPVKNGDKKAFSNPEAADAWSNDLRAKGWNVVQKNTTKGFFSSDVNTPNSFPRKAKIDGRVKE